MTLDQIVNILYGLLVVRSKINDTITLPFLILYLLGQVEAWHAWLLAWLLRR